MIPPRAVKNAFGDDYDECKLRISFRLQGGQVVMQFSDSVDRVRMTSGGARKLASMPIGAHSAIAAKVQTNHCPA